MEKTKLELALEAIVNGSEKLLTELKSTEVNTDNEFHISLIVPVIEAYGEIAKKYMSVRDCMNGSVNDGVNNFDADFNVELRFVTDFYRLLDVTHAELRRAERRHEFDRDYKKMLDTLKKHDD